MGRRIPFFFAAVLFLSLVATPVRSQEKSDGRSTAPPGGTGNAGGQRAPDSRYLGRLLIGDDAPDFELPASDGTLFHLRTLDRLESVALLFIQRPEQGIAAYADVGDSLRQHGVRVVFVCAERAVNMTRGWPNLWVLYDRRGEVARRYGAFDVVTGNTVPALFLLDTTRHVRFLAAGSLPSPTNLMAISEELKFGIWNESAKGFD